MIHVIDNYFIEVNQTEYTLVADSNKTDKTGRKVYYTISHHSTIASAVKACAKCLFKANMAGRTVELMEAVKEFDAVHNKLIETVNKNVTN